MIVLENSKFKINNKIFDLQDINSLLVVEYNGFKSMENGFNVYISLSGNLKIPISIRVSRMDKDNVITALTDFLVIDKIQNKKSGIHYWPIWGRLKQIIIKE